MSWLHTHIVMPIAERDRCAGLPRRLQELRRFDRLPEKAQRAEQQLRLQRLLQHAYETVPYYRRQFEQAGFHASDARIDLPLRLPVLTRGDLRNHSHSLLSSAYKSGSLLKGSSGGLTQVPVRFHRDLEAVRNKVALKLKMDSWAGFHAGDSVMMLWGPNCSVSRESNWRWRIYEGVFMRQSVGPRGTSPQEIKPEVMERLRWRYENQRPKALYGRSTLLAAFAEYLQQHGVRHRPKTVIATADVLSVANRKLIQSVFGCTPFNFYGSRDVGMIGAECSEHEGLHFHPWGSYVEFEKIGESPDGTLYRLLTTDLLNYGQPFIRYDTGDCVTLAEQSCSCGKWFPLVGQVVGRIIDGAVYANGKLVPNVVLGSKAPPIERRFRGIASSRIAQMHNVNPPSTHDRKDRDRSA